jgi:hypothetical protein
MWATNSVTLPNEAPCDDWLARIEKWRRPIGIASRWRLIQQGQNVLPALRAVFRLIAAIASLAQTGHPRSGIADAPFRGRAWRASDFPCNRPRRHAGTRQQHDPRPIAHPRLRLAGSSQDLT